MPIFEYNGPAEKWRPKHTLDGNGNRLELFPDMVSEPFTYTRDNGDVVEDRTFEVGEHVAAAENPNPEYFTEVIPNG
jgi:hypothetical protein